jgi:hypothetical protein
VESPCDSPAGSLRRSRRRSGGNLTLGLPGSSTEQPIPWLCRGSPPLRSFVPFDQRRMPPSRAGPTGGTTGAPFWYSPGIHCRSATGCGADAVAQLPGATTPGPWRHLATSTSDRNAVLCPWAQDGHRKPLNFRPVGSR